MNFLVNALLMSQNTALWDSGYVKPKMKGVAAYDRTYISVTRVNIDYCKTIIRNAIISQIFFKNLGNECSRVAPIGSSIS